VSKFVSIIITHFAMDASRSANMKVSIDSLIENTDYPYELIVIDNGSDLEDSKYLLNLCSEGKITTYIRNNHNMHFAYARNQGLELAQGDYFCIADNDIKYKKGWLEKCVAVLEAYPDEKWYATPMDYPQDAKYNGIQRYRTGEFDFNGENYTLNMRAGSNCFVITRENMKKLGKFPIHRIAGSKWTDRAVKSGYLAVVLPNGHAEDMGLRSGYNLNKPIPIYIKLSSGEEVCFNQDETSGNRGLYNF